MKPPIRHAQIAPVAALGGLVVLSTVALARAGVALCDRRIALAPDGDAPPTAMAGMAAQHGMAAMHAMAMHGTAHAHPAGVCPIVLFITVAAAALAGYAFWALAMRRDAERARREALDVLAHCPASTSTARIALAAGTLLGAAALLEPGTVSGPAALVELAVVIAGAALGSVGIAGIAAALVRAARTLICVLVLLAERTAGAPAPFGFRRGGRSAPPARRPLALRRGLRAPPLTA